VQVLCGVQMFGLARIKRAVHSSIARHGRSKIARAAHKLAVFIDSAVRNEGSEFSVNGELFVIERLASARFRYAIDVGANVGEWVLAAANHWPECHFDAFEIAPKTFQGLRLTTANQARISVHDIGLSDHVGSQTMYYFPDHPELTCDIPRHESYGSVPFEAETTTLDVFAKQSGITNIDFVKIDVEGAEHRVLKGAERLLNDGKIDCIQLEYGAFSIQSRFLLKDYYSLLSPQFWIGKIFPTHVAFGNYDWRAEDFRFSNYLCVSRNRGDLRSLLQ
jgi:FkbM family methyltransferase